MEKSNKLTPFGTDIIDMLDIDTDIEITGADNVVEDADRLDRPGVLHKIAVYYVQGMAIRQIAEMFDTRPAVIRNITRRESFKLIVNDISAEVIDQCKAVLRTATVKAVGTLISAMDESVKDNTRGSAANSVLDRVGLKGTDKIQINSKVTNMAVLSDEELVKAILVERQESKKPSYATDGEVEDNDGCIECPPGDNTQEGL